MLSRRQFAWAALGSATASALGPGVLDAALAQAPPPAPDPLALVNAQFREALRTRAFNPGALFSARGLAQARQFFGGAALPFAPEPVVTETKISGAPGSPEVLIYVVGAKAGVARPAVLHIHGGGFIIESAAGAVRDCQALSLAHDCVVVTVDYRLAPETPFPGPVDDCYAALSWMHANAEQIGIDTRRVAIKGESAGGGLAAMVAQAVRDRRGPPLCAQILIYPMLDDRTGSSRAVPSQLGQFIWTREANRFGWGSFLGQAPGQSRAPAGAVPARAPSLAGLPPTFIGVGSIDLFVEEDVDYALRLLREGVSTELLVVPGAYHAFDIFTPDAELTKAFAGRWSAALDRAFNATG